MKVKQVIKTLDIFIDIHINRETKRRMIFKYRWNIKP